MPPSLHLFIEQMFALRLLRISRQVTKSQKESPHEKTTHLGIQIDEDMLYFSIIWPFVLDKLLQE
jgi:hypothetical protein